MATAGDVNRSDYFVHHVSPVSYLSFNRFHDTGLSQLSPGNIRKARNAEVFLIFSRFIEGDGGIARAVTWYGLT